MPVREISADVPLDTQAAPRVRELPANVKLDERPAGASIPDRIGTGMLDPVYGAAQLIARTPMPPEAFMGLPADFDTSSVARAADERVSAREAKIEAERKAAGQTGTDWWRVAGNVVSPATLPLLAIPGGAVARPASVLSRLFSGGVSGALGGGAAAALQPVTEGEFGPEKLKQVGAGATIGAPIGAVGGAIAKAIAGNSPAEIERFIDDAYRRAIRPSVSGKGTARQIAQHDQQVIGGISSIVRNKANLRFADPSGEEVTGRLPQTLNEFSSAIEQTKQVIFDNYDALARQAGDQGAQISTGSAVTELRKFAGDPSLALPKFEPMRKYAEEMAASLEQTAALPPSVAQRMVRNLNEGLSAFYRASSPEAAGRAAIDDVVANQLRRGLDETIRDAVAPGYQALRNEYGALKSIEKEVANRVVVFGRQDPAGGLFGRLGTLATYEELARFAMHFDPSALGTAAAIRGSRKLTEHLANPNRAVRRMFEKAEKLEGEVGSVSPPPITGGMQPPRPTGGGQTVYGGQATPEGELASRGGQEMAARPIPTYRPGAQPVRASGPAQEIYGGPSDPFSVYGGGAFDPNNPLRDIPR